MAKTSRVFLSYASEDRLRVQDLYERLLAKGYEPWMDKHDIAPGESWEQKLWVSLRRADLFIPILTKASVNKRGVLQRELRKALKIWEEKLENDIYIIPVRLEECEAPESLSEFQWVDLFAPSGFGKLCTSIGEAVARRQHSCEAVSGIKFRTETLVSATNTPPRYDISIEYPQFDGPMKFGLDEVNTRIKGLIMSEAHIIRRVVFAEPLAPGFDPPTRSASLVGFSRVTFASEEIVSVEFDFSSFNYPSTYPNNSRRTLTFSLQPVVELSISDIIEREGGAASRILKICDEGIRAEFGDEYFSAFRSSSETDESLDISQFDLFTVTKEGVTFSIVGPCHAAGIAQVLIPYAELRDCIRRETPVWRLATAQSSSH